MLYIFFQFFCKNCNLIIVTPVWPTFNDKIWKQSALTKYVEFNISGRTTTHNLVIGYQCTRVLPIHSTSNLSGIAMTCTRNCRGDKNLVHVFPCTIITRVWYNVRIILGFLYRKKNSINTEISYICLSKRQTLIND